MSFANVLNLDVDALFEEHNVTEIALIQKKIQSVGESKREELRSMVGERYRDLLKAADTIAKMQESSNDLIENIQLIIANCRCLNEQQLIGFETIDDSKMPRSSNTTASQLNNYFSIMVQIKLLTSLAELIWSNIDRERFFEATEFFIFSRHISTGLLLDIRNPLMQRLDVAKKQWEILKPFHITIKQNVVSVLQREELNSDIALNCLLSLLLLEKNSLNGLLKVFLQMRANALLHCLSNEQGNSDGRRVKSRILDSLKILNGTMQLIGELFLDKGLLVQELHRYSDSDEVAPTLTLMNCSGGEQYWEKLPDIISKYRPKIDAQSLDMDEVRTEMEKWLDDTRRITHQQLANLFELVTAMAVIKDIKHEVNGYRKTTDALPIVQKFHLFKVLDFFDREYVPLINDRVKSIIHDNWSKAIQTTFDCLKGTLNSCDESQMNLWSENVEDLPPSLERALSDDVKLNRLLMNIKGFNKDTIDLCTKFDQQLATIVSETNGLLNDDTIRPQDKVVLMEFLRDTAESQLMELLNKIKDLKLSNDQRRELTHTMHTCVALLELCPHLKMSFYQQNAWCQSIDGALQKGIENWNRVCGHFEEEILMIWQQIIEGILTEHNCDRLFSYGTMHKVPLEDFTSWETITLDQKDEDDKIVQSTIRVPSQPRISLQSYIFSLVDILNRSIPQTLPQKALAVFNTKLLSSVISRYEHVATTMSAKMCQNVSLQLYFDLKFLQSIFKVTRARPELHQRFEAVKDKFKDAIDPFDFEIFAEHITENVQRSVARMSNQLGVVLPVATLNASANDGSSAAKSLAHTKDPNILSLSVTGSTSLWFPPLPIVNANTPNAAGSASSTKGTTPMTLDKQTSSSSKSTTSTASATSTGKLKSGATSFFGAMSQEWFR